MKPVIGHVVGTYLGQTETFIYSQLCAQRGVEPVVLTKSTQNLDQFPFPRVVELAGLDGAAPRRAARRLGAYAHGYRTGTAHRVARRAGAAQTDALHAHFGQMGWYSLGAARALGIPLVTTFYGMDIALPGHDRRWARRYRELFARGDLFFCEGPAMRERLIEIGAPGENVHVVPIGLDLARFPYAPRRRDGRLIVTQVARFVEKKGVDLTIEAFAAALPQLGPSELWLVGDGPHREALERLVARLGIAHSVRFLGLLSHADCAEVLRRAHVAMQPSRTAANGDTEGGAPTALLELQASGLPLIATKHADIPFVVGYPEELVDEGDVDALASALLRVAGCSEADWDARLAKGRELVERQHDVAAVARRQEGLYAELLKAQAYRPQRGARARSMRSRPSFDTTRT